MNGGIKRIVPIIMLCALCCLASGCFKPAETAECTVMIERGQNFYADKEIQTTAKNSDAVFVIRLLSGGVISDVDYPDYTVVHSDGYAELTLHRIKYSVVVKITVSVDYITYDGCGGVGAGGEKSFKIARPSGHLRYNTAIGTELFTRDGYVATGWNTAPDGSGKRIGFGSRAQNDVKKLYMQWEKAAPETDFVLEEKGDGMAVKKYLGTDEKVTIPKSAGGLPVTAIEPNAFSDSPVKTVILPETVEAVRDMAFARSWLTTLYMYDNLRFVSDDGFDGCNIKTLYVNAVTPPAYAGTYYSTFTDKIDYLASVKDEKKIVLFSGSSARFGYDSPQISRAFPEYKVVNMGVYAYTNAVCQLDAIREYMGAGDILLHAPEFNGIDEQFTPDNRFDRHFYNMVETDYDILSRMDLTKYTKVFTSWQIYREQKSLLPPSRYEENAKNYDEDGRPCAYETYNVHGDFVYKRPNHDREEQLEGRPTDFTVNAVSERTVELLNAAYAPFKELGVKALFSYAPLNKSSLGSDSTPERRNELHERLKASLDIPVISDPEDYIYRTFYFYLIDNHLSDEGVQIRTRNIISDLSAWLTADEG